MEYNADAAEQYWLDRYYDAMAHGVDLPGDIESFIREAVAHDKISQLQRQLDDAMKRKRIKPRAASDAALLNRTDAAAYLGGISEDHFDRHVRDHVPVRMIGSVPMFRRSDLDAYAAQGTKPL